jgi:hypothetical protein
MHLPVTLTPELLQSFTHELTKDAGLAPAQQKELLKALGLMGAGAVGYDQATKAFGDWQQGRSLRQQTRLY